MPTGAIRKTASELEAEDKKLFAEVENAELDAEIAELEAEIERRRAAGEPTKEARQAVAWLINLKDKTS